MKVSLLLKLDVGGYTGYPRVYGVYNTTEEGESARADYLRRVEKFREENNFPEDPKGRKFLEETLFVRDFVVGQNYFEEHLNGL